MNIIEKQKHAIPVSLDRATIVRLTLHKLRDKRREDRD